MELSAPGSLSTKPTWNWCLPVLSAPGGVAWPGCLPNKEMVSVPSFLRLWTVSSNFFFFFMPECNGKFLAQSSFFGFPDKAKNRTGEVSVWRFWLLQILHNYCGVYELDSSGSLKKISNHLRYCSKEQQKREGLGDPQECKPWHPQNWGVRCVWNWLHSSAALIISLFQLPHQSDHTRSLLSGKTSVDNTWLPPPPPRIFP